jgi:hypothetical protein
LAKVCRRFSLFLRDRMYRHLFVHFPCPTLERAAETGNISCVRYFLSSGIEPNRLYSYTMTIGRQFPLENFRILEEDPGMLHCTVPANQKQTAAVSKPIMGSGIPENFKASSAQTTVTHQISLEWHRAAVQHNHGRGLPEPAS